jgi:Na+-transporting NADH:ubiquinone oxidoreductase subunit C
MKQEKKSFSETRFYPIFFMLILTIIFVGLLAIFYHSTSERVRLYEETSYKTALLQLFGFQSTDLALFNQHFEKQTTAEFDYYLVKQDQELIGFAFDVTGSGLWGTINAIIGVDSQFETIVALDILKQNETPGLGGRITEDWFKKQFSKKPLKQNGELIKFKLITEEESPETLEIKQITGATFSSKAVVDIVYNEVLKKAQILDR